jgi:hypothetical protein
VQTRAVVRCAVQMYDGMPDITRGHGTSGARELLKVAPTALAQVSDSFRDDVFIVSTAIEVDRSVLRYASARLQSLLDEPPVAWVK